MSAYTAYQSTNTAIVEQRLLRQSMPLTYCVFTAAFTIVDQQPLLFVLSYRSIVSDLLWINFHHTRWQSSNTDLLKFHYAFALAVSSWTVGIVASRAMHRQHAVDIPAVVCLQ